MVKNSKHVNVGNRSNYSLMPYAIRYKICCMLHDGATVNAVANEPEIKAAYARLGMELKHSAVTRLKQNKEYLAIIEKRTAFKQAQDEENLTVAMLREMGSAETIAESVKIDLLKLVKDCVKANPDDPKEVERLVRSAVNLSNTAKDRQIADLRKKLDRANAEIEELKAEIAELKVEHKNEIERLTAKENTVAEPARVADELANILGVKK